MNREWFKVITVLLISLLAASVLPMAPVAAQEPDVYMWIEPSSINLSTDTVSPGYRFTITVMLHSEQDVYSYSIGLKYNRTQLKCTAADFTKDFTAGHDTTTAGPIIDTSYLGNGTILATESCKGADYIPGPREGSLMWAEFEVLIAPGKYENLTSLISISAFYPADTWVKNPDLVDILDEARDATYTYTWAPPTTKPHLAVSPALVELGPYERVVGKDFDIQVLIKNLEVGWDLQNASFTLSYNATVIDVIGGPANITIAPLWTTFSIDYTPGQINITVSDPTTTPAGDVLVATIKFTVLIQGESPPLPVGYFDKSDLTFSNIELWDHVGPVPTDPSEPGVVKVYAFIILPLAWLEIQPANITVGPEYYVGRTFKVDVVVKNLDEHWYVVLFQFRVLFDADLVDVVKVEEGPWFPEGPWNKYGTEFGSWVDYDDPMYGDNLIVYDLLLPNSTTGEWDQEVFPSADNETGAVMATITFKVVDQPITCNASAPPYELNLTLIAFWSEGHEAFVDKDSNYVEADYNKFVHGHVTILPSPYTGRQIDLFGGANNAGHGVVNAPFPDPYGGQGSNNPMDLVIPQSEVYLFAKVTYNCWPVQSKVVNFEIEGPFEKNEQGELVRKDTHKIWAKLTAITNKNGIASLVYRMPWPCEDPYSITGIWRITATCNLYDEIIEDTMIFYYEDLVQIISVTTDKYYYVHGETVEVTVNYGSHSMQKYNATFAITITDEVGVPIAMILKTVEVGGAEFCELAEDSFTVRLTIPKWAAAGYAYVHVNCFDKDPTEGGFAWCPEYTPPPEIWIKPE